MDLGFYGERSQLRGGWSEGKDGVAVVTTVTGMSAGHFHLSSHFLSDSSVQVGSCL